MFFWRQKKDIVELKKLQTLVVQMKCLTLVCSALHTGCARDMAIGSLGARENLAVLVGLALHTHIGVLVTHRFSQNRTAVVSKQNYIYMQKTQNNALTNASTCFNQFTWRRCTAHTSHPCKQGHQQNSPRQIHRPWPLLNTYEKTVILLRTKVGLLEAANHSLSWRSKRGS